MKARTLRRHLRESFKSLRRNGWMTFASVSAVTVTLLLVGVFFVILMNMNKFASDLEKDVEIRTHIDLTASKKDQENLKQKIEKLDLVESIKYSSKEDELKHLIKTMGKEWNFIEKQDNPLHDVFIVKTKKPTDTPIVAEQIRKMEFVHSAEYGEKKVEKLFKVLKTSRNIGLVLIIGLLFTAMFLISNTIKITIFARRREIEIMKLVGATNWFIRWPFLFEGIWLGILGSIIPIGIVASGYYYAYDFMEMRIPRQVVQPLEYTPFVYEVSLIMLLIGVIIGGWGSFISVRRFLKV
ncbi:permease-like cell division protein FtsX [Lederbergia wuyishanensis]|uniref:Cell division protein FtsX n=1 Tax=Lederbergia wuyishanensis TaxID=1347903 RepID=A0ABU0D8R5_9BACI|nr:permease-like cell division protein FtsX [Lederbergia wuyishanensis]MCJ8007642.1 permease-like cell division protein FtsX [Lederbergia wuyishanensis]MDQ0344773.1 cell division transport system permease protein [Lederbergia wuyishanensis]